MLCSVSVMQSSIAPWQNAAQPPLRNERGSHDRLAEGRRRREHAMVMRQEGVECLDLRAVQRPLESQPAWSGLPIALRV